MGGGGGMVGQHRRRGARGAAARAAAQHTLDMCVADWVGVVAKQSLKDT